MEVPAVDTGLDRCYSTAMRSWQANAATISFTLTTATTIQQRIKNVRHVVIATASLIHIHTYIPLVFIIIIIIILFVQNKMHIKHVNKISEQDNKAQRSALTAALSTIIQVQS